MHRPEFRAPSTSAPKGATISHFFQPIRRVGSPPRSEDETEARVEEVMGKRKKPEAATDTPLTPKPRAGPAKKSVKPQDKPRGSLPLNTSSDVAASSPAGTPSTTGSYPSLTSLLTEPSWKEALGAEFSKPYMSKLQQFLDSEATAGKQVFPPPDLVFNAFNSCPLSHVRLVILGQDPYHGAGQAMGLSFSVPRGVRTPPSLVNIYKELNTDVGFTPPGHGDLSSWARQGVLLLNTVLTVRKAEAFSHAKQGWESLTDAAIRAIARRAAQDGDAPVVFLLWGAHAQSKAKLLPQHSCVHVLKSPHPSGLSAHRGFFGNKHFSQSNDILKRNNASPVDWSLPTA